MREAHRGKGYGRLLLEEFLRIGKKEGVGKVFLEVREGNLPGRGLYEALGFQIFGRRKDYYRDPIEDALLMERIIE